ncbi:MAG: DUF6527 family protein [Opitutae bacterium]
MPAKLTEGILYISIDYTTMMHLCACGCGREVVTPLSPKDWKLIFDGETISIHPSIGSWALPCRSHYFIRNDTIKWAGDWSEEKIAQNRMLDLSRKRGVPVNRQPISDEFQSKIETTSIWHRVQAWFGFTRPK